MFKKYRLILAVVFLLSLLNTNLVSSQSALPPGSLDPTFSDDGKLLYYSGWEYGTDVAIQPDGKILVAGIHTGSTPHCISSILRFNVDGSLDSSFGDYGLVEADFGDQPVDSGQVFVQPDGKILAVARACGPTGFGLARFLPNGEPDTSFSGGTVFMTPPFPVDFPFALLLPSGKILLAGQIYNSNNYWSSNGIFLARLNPDGTLDTTFGENGYVKDLFIQQPQTYYGIWNLLLQGDGNIVMAGILEHTAISIRRYQPDGSFDIEYTQPVDLSIICPTDTVICRPILRGAAIQPDGKVVIQTGYSATNQANEWLFNIFLVRYNLDGLIDPSFNDSGGRPVDIWANDLVIQANGKIIVAGTSGNGPFGFSRFNPDGTLDTGFGDQGRVDVPFDTYAILFRAALSIDNKLVGMGYSDYGDIALARFILESEQQPGVVWLKPKHNQTAARNVPLGFYQTGPDGSRLSEQQPIYLGVSCATVAHPEGERVARYDLGSEYNNLRFIAAQGVYKAVFKSSHLSLANPASCRAGVYDQNSHAELGNMSFTLKKHR